MKFKSKRRLRIIKQYSFAWTFAFLYYSFLRGEGTHELGSTQLGFWEIVIACLILGPIFGSISGYAQILSEEHGYKRISLQKLLALRVVFAVFFLASIILLGYIFFGKNIGLIKFAFEPGSFAIYLYIVSVDIFMFCLRQINLFFGSNNLWSLFRGKFYTPREEERIFMFLDLQSSTKHAEKLGHIEYSKMIQDCFNDLGNVIENEAEIYQYVGDEVILTWILENGLKNQNCINAYFNFKQQLDRKKEYYIRKYGCEPFFKAGINAGIVTVTQVGKYKKEIAYHGDTINTAARIQGKCNELKQELLISDNLRNLLDNAHFTFEKIDSIQLRGKEELVPIYAVYKGIKKY